MRRGDPTKPWSLARTPFFVRNPSSADVDPRLVDWDVSIEQYNQILEAPDPSDYIDNGYVLYDGPSELDGQPIIAIATLHSGNVKTADMIQTWILLKYMSPQEALDTGADFAICGDCRHRGIPVRSLIRKKRRVITPAEASRGVAIEKREPGTGRPIPGIQARIGYAEPVHEARTCYVVAAQAPMGVWKRYWHGREEEAPSYVFEREWLDPRRESLKYPNLDERELARVGWGRMVRLGSYGDPAAVPARVWESLVIQAVAWTGYTHQWDKPEHQNLRRLLMASVDNREEMEQAHDMGWRTFRILRGIEAEELQLVAGTEIHCPSQARGVKCDACCACQGLMPGRRARRERPGVPSVAVRVHPRWQLIYDPEIRSFRARMVPEDESKQVGRDRPPEGSEFVAVDYMPGSQIRWFKDLGEWALKMPDPAGAVQSQIHKYPSETQGYLIKMAEAMTERSGRRVRSNPLLAIVGNPPMDSLLDQSRIEEADARFMSRSAVAGPGSRGRLKGRKAKANKAKKRKAKSNPQEKKKRRPKFEKITVEEARRRGIKGIDEAVKRYKRFHGKAPRHVKIYHLPDGKKKARLEHMHVGLHRTLETPYVVNWPSNKQGSLWLHEHPEGEGAPLEVLDPDTGITKKIGGDFVVDDWWHS